MVSRCNADDLIGPINISNINVINKCDVKCSLVINYNPSSVTVHNKGNYLSLDYEPNSKSNFDIKFNSIKMTINEVRIYFPSLHNYSGSKVDGELLLVHNGNGSNCIISIPIVSKKSSTNGEKTLSSIFENVKSSIPNKNESTSLNISNFNISNLLPLNVPYYYYQGQLVFEPCTQNYNYIVFDKKDYSINIDDEFMAEMKTIFKQQNGSVSKIKNLKILSYNQKGATNVELNGSDDIYIECKPINTIGGESANDNLNEIPSQTALQTPSVNTQRMSFEDLSKNPAFDVVVSFMGLFILYTTGKYALNYFNSTRK